MSRVLLSKRKDTRFTLQIQVQKLRMDLTDLILKNMGIKDLEDSMRKKHFYSSVIEYMDMLSNSKKKLTELLSDLEDYINAANSIYPKRNEDYEVRRKYQDKALGTCESINIELQFIIYKFDCNINCYKSFINDIENIISRIKGWRTADNKSRRKLNSR